MCSSDLVTPAPPRAVSVLLKLGALLVLGPLLLAGAGTLLGAGLAPAAPAASSLVDSVRSELLDFPPLGDTIERYTLDERSVVLDAEGNQLAVLRAVNREVVALAEIPVDVQNAVLATEDASFREHDGVNWRAIGRAALGNLREGEITSGASTITQQLIKLLTGQDATTIQRKLREATYAIELEQRWTKDQILELYLNEVYLGNGVYGFGTAAEFYFSKEARELTVPEAAVLAGMLRAPNTNDPIANPDAALQRRNIVISQMRDAGFISAVEEQEYLGTPLELDPSPLREAEEAFFVSYVRTVLRQMDELGGDPESRERLVLRGGLTIETTLEPRVQELAEAAIRDVLTDVDGPQAALTAIEPDSGRIIAIGFGPKEFGTGAGQTEVLPAVPGVGSSFGRQPGSSFKAFEIVAALEAGVPPTYTIDTPSPYVPRRNCANSDWRPGNYSDGGGGTMNMAAATARSSNVYFAHLVDQFTGPEGLADVAERLGIVNTELDEPAVCSMVLGATEVYPLDMASAFGTLANQGTYCPPFAVERILGPAGEVLFEADRAACEQVVDREIAATTTSLLRGPIENGTATRNGAIGRPAAGKTGTTQGYRDAWFVGYIPQLSTAVWVGNETPTTMVDERCGEVTGGCLPTMIWSRFMRDAIDAQGYPVAEFPPPPRYPSDRVPDVVGRTLDDAEAVLADAEFTSTSQTVADWRPAGTVVAQNPPGGSEAPTGTQVLLSVSDGAGERPVVPSVVGLSEAEALAALQEAGLAGVVSLVPVDDEAQYGFVVGQSPGPGELAPDQPGVTPDSADVGQVVIEIGRPRGPDDPPASEEPSEEPSAEPTPSVSPTASPSPTPSPAPEPPAPPDETPAPSETPPPPDPGDGEGGDDGGGGDDGEPSPAPSPGGGGGDGSGGGQGQGPDGEGPPGQDGAAGDG